MSNKEAVSYYRKRAKTYATKAFGSKCGICGYDKCVQALDFHHINSEEKIYAKKIFNSILNINGSIS